MRIKTLRFFPSFDFQNGGRRMKILHVIVMAICNILLAQGLQILRHRTQRRLLFAFEARWHKSERLCDFNEAINTTPLKTIFHLFRIQSRYSFAVI